MATRDDPTSGDPELEPDDPYARPAQTYPQLSLEMAERVAAYGQEEWLPPGATVFARGDRGVDFFLVLEGGIEIIDLDDQQRPNMIARLLERSFTGEIHLFNNRETLLGGRTTGDTRVVRIKRPDFRRLISAEPDIGEIILRAFILRRVGFIRHAHGGVFLIGPAHGGDTLRLQRFLTRNAYPYRLLDTEADAQAVEFLNMGEIPAARLPVVFSPGKSTLFNPSNAELADHLGLTEPFDPAHVYDLAVLGAGPAGLAAAVYGASEGLDTIVIEGMAPGGQAGTSSKIENYLGFPTGISGAALAGRAQVQAQKFGARLAISRAVSGIDCTSRPFRLALDDGQSVSARAIVLATGARYRQLDVPGYARFEGQGIHYAATPMEQKLCGADEVIVVGGGNSAGQAAVFLSRTVGHVHILIRGSGLAATMSDYLIRRIELSPKITLHTRTEITALAGDTILRQVTWTNRDTKQSQTLPICNVFVMIGAEPNTEWLDGCLELDRAGFVKTGVGKNGERLDSPYATSLPGVYAVGDVRSGSVKRVASGVGEGSVVIQAVHQYLHPPPA